MTGHTGRCFIMRFLCILSVSVTDFGTFRCVGPIQKREGKRDFHPNEIQFAAYESFLRCSESYKMSLMLVPSRRVSNAHTSRRYFYGFDQVVQYSKIPF